MKIGMFLDTAFPPDSRVENEGVSLIKAGHEVFLFSIDYDNRAAYENVNGIQVYRYKATKLTYKLSALAYTWPFYHNSIKPSIADFIQTISPDALHIHDMVIARAVLDVNNGQLPVTLDLHENRPEIMKHYKHVKEIPGRWLINLNKWAKIQQQLIEEVDQVIVVTELAKNDIITSGAKSADQITVVPNTILPEVYLNYQLDEAIVERWKAYFTILYLGDTSERRGTFTAVEAMAIIKQQVPEARLVLVGNSSAVEQLKVHAERHEVTNQVVFEGWQDVSLFPSYVKAAAVCLSPLLRNRHHDTTFANKLFQYMAMGKPVVVSDSTAQKEVVQHEDAGLIFTAGNAGELADRLMLLYRDRALSQRLGNNGKIAVAERWNWDITSKGLLDMYNH